MSNECLKCKFRGTVENSRHSSCQHPEAQMILQSSELLATLMHGIVNQNRIPRLTRITVEFSEQGIEGGYCHFPINFDPIWLKSCTGFEEI